MSGGLLDDNGAAGGIETRKLTHYGEALLKDITQTAHEKWLWVRMMPYCNPAIRNTITKQHIVRRLAPAFQAY